MSNSSSPPTLSPFDSFGTALKYLRRRAHLSQRELSIAVGYSESQISRYESYYRPPDLPTLRARFIPALGLDHEPETANRLLALAAAARAEPLLGPPAEPPSGGPRTNLPAPLTSFLGRAAEMAELKRRLSAASPGVERLMTLTGAGGTGKTRLALQLAHDLRDRFPGGAWLVELAPVLNPEYVPQTVATALGLREVPGYPLTRTVSDYLRPHPALLILDGCEHLIDACARLVDALLRACPHLRVLVTSHEALGFLGEAICLVPPLALPAAWLTPVLPAVAESEAVLLFVERARAVQPDFQLTRVNASAVARVCQQLDGLPLAIELAAARLRGLTVDQLAERLDDRFGLLAGGNRTAPPRHQTLAALLDWSYDLLPEPERTLLRRLAVFRDGWTLEAAEAVCAGAPLEAPVVLALLLRLVDKSLVVIEAQGPHMRYRLLESVKQYAWHKALGHGETRALQERFYGWCLGLITEAAPHLKSSSQLVLLDRLEAEHDNFNAALDWALQAAPNRPLAGLRLAAALGWFWYLRGSWSAARSWLEEALAQAGQAAHPVARAQALNALGFLADCQGSEAVAEAALEESVALGRQTGNTLILADALAYLGELVSWQPQTERAEPLLTEAISLFRRLGTAGRWGLAAALKFLAEAAFFQDDYDRAEALFQESARLFRELGERWGLSNTLTSHAAVVLRRGNLHGAAALFQQALDLQREMHYPFGWVHIFNRLRHAAYLASRGQGDPAWVVARLTESLALAQDVGHQWGIAASLGQLAKAAQAQGQAQRAARLLGAAEVIREASQVPVPPYPFRAHERDVAELRAALSPEAFEAAWAEGRAMSLEAAIAFALEAYAPSAERL